MFPKKNRGGKNELPMRPLNVEFQEDEYGYVSPVEGEKLKPPGDDKPPKKISKSVMMQLPSRNLDDLLETRTASDCDAPDSRTLGRSAGRTKSIRIKSALLNGVNITADQVYEVLTKSEDMSPDEINTTLREMHQSLTIKRILKRRLNRDEELRKRNLHISVFTYLKYKVQMFFHDLGDNLKELAYSLELWYNHLKTIQGKFGTGVTSYFVFLRWLLYLNIFSCILMFGFVVIPQWIYEASVSSYHRNSSAEFSFFDLLTGAGWFSDSVLYYGDYTNNTINLIDDTYYDMPLAYLLTFGTFAITHLVIVAFSLAKSYQQNYVDASDEAKNVFANKVLCGWDYSIETPGAAQLRKLAVYNDLKETLAAELEIEIDDTLGRKLFNGCVCFFLNLLILSIISGAGVLVHLMLEHNFKQTMEHVTGIPLVQQMTLSVAMTAIAFVSYQVFHFVGRVEWYLAKDTRLYLAMCRDVLLKLVLLGVLLRFWMFVHIPDTGQFNCFETQLGEEIYRLVLVNFIFSLIFSTIVGELCRKYFYLYIGKWVKHPQFDIAYNTLDIIYYQTLLWIGTFFSPLLPLVVLIVYILQFYIKRYSTTMNCMPSTKPWSASHARTVFLCLAFVNFLLCILAIGYNILRISPSTVCGPFRLLKKRYDIIMALLPTTSAENMIITRILEYATSAGVVFAVMTALCVVVYYVRAQSIGYARMVKLIHDQLTMEGKDKVFLLQLFQEALEQKNVTHWTDYPGPSGTAAFEGPSLSPARESNGSRNEIVNEVYKDYYHNVSPTSPKSRSAFARKYNPGYMPAAVPANNIDPEYGGSDCSSSHENIARDQYHPSVDTASYESDSDERSHRRPRALSPKNMNRSSSSSVLNASQGDVRSSPTRKQVKHSEDVFPRTVHQQGFQYLARGEAPPRFNQAQDNVMSPGKVERNAAK